jgi:RNA polymerase sigma factor (sigma-70 family)
MLADIEGLYVRFAPRLRSIVRRDVQAPAVVVDDACQSAWCRLVQHAARIEEDAAIAWLMTTAVHEAVLLARRVYRDASLEAEVEQAGEADLADDRPGPDELAELREQLQLVRSLPRRQQRFLWLRAAGFSYEDIVGREPGLTRRTLERQILRGRTRLRAVSKQ